jgi:GLPGLI family protein
MKKAFYCPIIMGLLSAINITAQNSGVVVYEQTVKMEIKLEGDAAQFAHMMPKERKFKKELLFSEKASIFKNATDTGENDVVDESTGGNRNIMIKMTVPDDIVYNDLENNKRIEQKEFFTRNFLIERDIEALKWKMTGNTKEIAGFTCMEAEVVDSVKNIKAWFTPQISVSSGPGIFAGLPGLILSINENDGANVTTALSVDLKQVADKELKKPSKGKKVSEEEFQKIVEEKIIETGGHPGGAQRGGQTQSIMIEINK